MKIPINQVTPILTALFLAVANAPAAVVVEPPGATVAGKTIAEWSAAWWQWAAALAPPGDPFTDTTGQFASVNQSGPVFFLAGSPPGVGSNSRHFNVPANTYVMVPLLAGEWSQLELGFGLTETEIRQAAEDQANQINFLHATLDGTMISESTLFTHREVSPGFSFISVAGNLVNVPPGASGIAVADGYFLMLDPLTLGTHVLNYGGGASALNVYVDETDTITAVAPISIAITTQPVSKTVNVGQSVSFTVTATGFPLNYQWRKDGLDLPGATKATLSLPVVQTNDAGGYTVTVSNELGAVTSAPPAVLAVTGTTPQGVVVAWGYNGYGQTDVPVAAQGEITAIAAGFAHSVALRIDGSVVAWGYNAGGQTMVPVAARSGVIAIVAGAWHTLALKTNGSVLAWGDQLYGATDIPLAAQSGVMAIAAGGVHSAALKVDGSVVAWGWNGDGQTAVPVAAQSGVVAISAGGRNTAALKTDGTVVVWGDNSYDQTNIPAAAQSDVVAIAAGERHIVALKSDGSVVAWGFNAYGQTDVPVAAWSDVAAIAAGSYHTVALKSDGSMLAWGDNSSGQTTVPTGVNEVTAIAAGASHTLALLGTAAPTAPTILTQPVSQTVNAGQSASFTVTASGYPLFYQWRKDGVDLPGVNGDTVSLPAVQTNAAGGYTVVVSNFLGSVTSTPPAVLTVNVVAAAQQAYLKASNTGADDSFGMSVSVSGDTMVVGASYESSNATGVNGNQSDNSAANSGAAYVFVRNGTTWTQQAYLKASNTGAGDLFGFSVAVSGDTVVVGALQEGSNAAGVNGNQSDNSTPGASAAYVFVRNGTNWTQQAYLKASNTGANDYFGIPVAVSGDTVVVGASEEASNATGVNGNQNDNSAPRSGAVYVFVRNGATWSQQAYLKASNTESQDYFGTSVGVSGNTVVVGAAYEDSNATGVNGTGSDPNSFFESGAAYVFVRNGTTWSQQAYLKASNTGKDDRFGISVAASGDTVVVGAYTESSNATGVNGNQNDNSAEGAGAAYVFVRKGTTWGQQAYLKASNTGANDSYGLRVALSGDTVVVGAAGESSNATGVNGDQSDNSARGSGAAYVFVRDGTTWTQMAYLKASNTGSGDSLGSVSVSGDTVVVGASGESSNATGVNGNQSDNSAGGSGAGYIFTGLGHGPKVAIVPDSSNGYFVRFNAAPELTYRLQRAPSVTGPWSTIDTQTAPASGSIEYHETTPLPNAAFYRTAQP